MMTKHIYTTHFRKWREFSLLALTLVQLGGGGGGFAGDRFFITYLNSALAPHVFGTALYTPLAVIFPTLLSSRSSYAYPFPLLALLLAHTLLMASFQRLYISIYVIRINPLLHTPARARALISKLGFSANRISSSSAT